MTDHTQEPWQINMNKSVCNIEDAYGNLIAKCLAPFPFDTSYDERDANCRRIVACINACAGLSTVDIEAKGVQLI